MYHRGSRGVFYNKYRTLRWSSPDNDFEKYIRIYAIKKKKESGNGICIFYQKEALYNGNT